MAESSSTVLIDALVVMKILLDLLHSWGFETKVERGGRVFPEI